MAFTYNDPVIWAEYAIDTARACRAVGMKTVAVTAGYITPAARPAFYEVMDAANVDLKGFTEEFYWKLTSGHLEPVLDTLRWLVHETDVWVEITNLVIPQANDTADELRRMCDWIVKELGAGRAGALHGLSPRFPPDRPRAHAAETLARAYQIGPPRRAELRVYRQRQRRRPSEHLLPGMPAGGHRARRLRAGPIQHPAGQVPLLQGGHPGPLRRPGGPLGCSPAADSHLGLRRPRRTAASTVSPRGPARNAAAPGAARAVG